MGEAAGTLHPVLRIAASISGGVLALASVSTRAAFGPQRQAQFDAWWGVCLQDDLVRTLSVHLARFPLPPSPPPSHHHPAPLHLEGPPLPRRRPCHHCLHGHWQRLTTAQRRRTCLSHRASCPGLHLEMSPTHSSQLLHMCFMGTGRRAALVPRLRRCALLRPFTVTAVQILAAILPAHMAPMLPS